MTGIYNIQIPICVKFERNGADRVVATDIKKIPN